MRSAVSVFLIILLFLIAPVLFVVTSIRFNVATTDYLKQELVRLDAYGIAVSEIDTQINQISISPQYPVTHAELADIAHQAIPETWLRRNVENVLDDVKEWLKSKPGTRLSLPVDLREPKANLSKSIDALLTEKLPTIQPCPKHEPKEDQGICQFSGMTLAQLKTELSHQGLDPDIVQQILPDSIDLANPDLSKFVGTSDANNPNGVAAKSAQIRKNLDLFHARYQQVVSLFNVALGIYGLVLLLYMALNAMRGWHRFVRWTGAALFIIGLAPLALAFASGPLVEQILIPRLPLSGHLPTELLQIAPQFIRDTRAAIFNPLLITGLALVFFGLDGMIGAHWIAVPWKKHQSHQ